MSDVFQPLFNYLNFKNDESFRLLSKTPFLPCYTACEPVLHCTEKVPVNP